MSDGWTKTNTRERHLRRKGRVIGKVLLVMIDLADGSAQPVWRCAIHTPRLAWIGSRKTEAGARAYVERAVIRQRNIESRRKRATPTGGPRA